MHSFGSNLIKHDTFVYDLTHVFLGQQKSDTRNKERKQQKKTPSHSRSNKAIRECNMLHAAAALFLKVPCHCIVSYNSPALVTNSLSIYTVSTQKFIDRPLWKPNAPLGVVKFSSRKKGVHKLSLWAIQEWKKCRKGRKCREKTTFSP